jgi:hypothetical protein
MLFSSSKATIWALAFTFTSCYSVTLINNNASRKFEFFVLCNITALFDSWNCKATSVCCSCSIYFNVWVSFLSGTAWNIWLCCIIIKSTEGSTFGDSTILKTWTKAFIIIVTLTATTTTSQWYAISCNRCN